MLRKELNTMEFCECWQLIQKDKQICNGTKERDECFCNGNKNNCTFYPKEKNTVKILRTPEMWLQAQEDGKYYITISNHDDKIIYNKNTGLLYNDDKSLCTPADYWHTFDSLMQEQWVCCDNYMTKQEAEKKFRIKIIDD